MQPREAMKILYIVPFVPWAVKVRSFNLIPRLARRHEIILVCVSSAGPSEEQKVWLAKYCKEVVHVRHSALKGIAQSAAALPTRTPLRIAYCKSRAANDVVRRVYERVRPDVVYVERWRAQQFVPPEAKVPVLCDPTDSMTLYNRRLMKAGVWWERLVAWEEYRKFLGYEGKLSRAADVCVFCSQVDMECVKLQAPEVKFALVPNGVDCEKYFFKKESEEEPATLVFTGSFKYRPNCHAVKYFLDEIFPQIQKDVPAAKFLAVGNGAGAALAAYRGRAGFEAVDFVPDLRPYLAKATVVVAPLTVGAGVSNKLGEGFAVGTPVVATPLACGDLPVRNGEQLLIATSAGEFADHVVRLLGDSALRRQMAVRSRRLVEEQYDWETVSRKMESIMQRLLEAAAGERGEQEFATA
jgi:glycosyltransferase involved in cell wall biosynthesis